MSNPSLWRLIEARFQSSAEADTRSREEEGRKKRFLGGVEKMGDSGSSHRRESHETLTGIGTSRLGCGMGQQIAEELILVHSA